MAMRFMQYFEFEHLPPKQAAISKEFWAVAHKLMDQIETFPDVPEAFAGFHKLIEAKDCFVRASLEDRGGDE